jgi:hypothetical protein
MKNSPGLFFVALPVSCSRIEIGILGNCLIAATIGARNYGVFWIHTIPQETLP